MVGGAFSGMIKDIGYVYTPTYSSVRLCYQLYNNQDRPFLNSFHPSPVVLLSSSLSISPNLPKEDFLF